MGGRQFPKPVHKKIKPISVLPASAASVVTGPTIEQPVSKNLSPADSFGFLALILTVVFVVITIPLLMKVLLLAASSVLWFIFMGKSHWTHQWSRLWQYGIASLIVAVLLAIGVRQFYTQWRTEHPRAASSPTAPALSPASMPPSTAETKASEGTADNHKATVPTKVRPKTRITAAQSAPSGEIGVFMGKHSALTVDGSQIGGYKTGIWQGDESVGQIKNSQIGADQSKLPPVNNNSVIPEHGNGSGGLVGITIDGGRSDIPLVPILVHGQSVVPPQKQKELIDSLAMQWKREHDMAIIGKQGIHWMNQQLEKQDADFRIQVPDHCPPGYQGLAGVHVYPGTSLRLDGVTTNGVAMPIIGAPGSQLEMNNTRVLGDSCD